MDIKKYEVLLSTLDKGCFAKACEDLGYTQPAITHMMKSMEREIGFPLLKRSNKGIQLTSEGREVLPLIRELVAANDRLNKYYDMLRGVETGSVRRRYVPDGRRRRGCRASSRSLRRNTRRSRSTFSRRTASTRLRSGSPAGASTSRSLPASRTTPSIGFR